MRSGQWSFVQQVHQQALYATISRSFQAQLHARALRFYEANGTAAKTPERATNHATVAGLTCAAMYYIFTAAVCAPNSLDLLIVWMQQWWVQFDRLDESERKMVPRVQVAFMSAVRGQEARQLGHYKDAVKWLLKSVQFLDVPMDQNKVEPWSLYAGTDKAPSTTERLNFVFNFQHRALEDFRALSNGKGPATPESPGVCRRVSGSGGSRLSLASPSKHLNSKAVSASVVAYSCSSQHLLDARSRAYSACGRLLWTIVVGAKYWGVKPYKEAWPELEDADGIFMLGQSLYLCELGNDMAKILELLGMMSAGLFRIVATDDEAFSVGQEKSLAMSRRLRRMPNITAIDTATVDFWEAVCLWWGGKDMVRGAEMLEKCAADRVAALSDSTACDAFGQAALLALIDGRLEDAQRIVKEGGEAAARSLSVQNDEMVQRQSTWVAALRGDVAEASRCWTMYSSLDSSSTSMTWRGKVNMASTEILCLLAERVGRVELVIAQLNRTNREMLEMSDGASADRLTTVGHLRRSGVASVDTTLMSMVVETASLYESTSSPTSALQPFFLLICVIFAWYDERAGLYTPDAQSDAKVTETLETLCRQFGYIVRDFGGMIPMQALADGLLYFRRNDYQRASDRWVIAADVTTAGYGMLYPIAHALLAAEARRLGITPGAAAVHEREARRLVTAFGGPRPLVTSLVNTILRAKAEEDAALTVIHGSGSASSYESDSDEYTDSSELSVEVDLDGLGGRAPLDEGAEQARAEVEADEQMMRQLAPRVQHRAHLRDSSRRESDRRLRHQLSSASVSTSSGSRAHRRSADGGVSPLGGGGSSTPRAVEAADASVDAAAAAPSLAKSRRRSVSNIFRSTPNTPRGGGETSVPGVSTSGRHRSSATPTRLSSPRAPTDAAATPASPQIVHIHCETAVVGPSPAVPTASPAPAHLSPPQRHSHDGSRHHQRVALVMVLRFGEKKRRVLVDDGMVVLDVLRDNAPSSIPLDRLTARLDGVEVSRSMRLSVLLERMGADGETEPELELVERVGDGW
jgi:hypothetical protein